MILKAQKQIRAHEKKHMKIYTHITVAELKKWSEEKKLKVKFIAAKS